MGEEESANGFKALAALCLFGIAALGGMLPMRLQDVGSRVISALNTAAGGVFFASAMVKLLRSTSKYRYNNNSSIHETLLLVVPLSVLEMKLCSVKHPVR